MKDQPQITISVTPADVYLICDELVSTLQPYLPTELDLEDDDYEGIVEAWRKRSPHFTMTDPKDAELAEAIREMCDKTADVLARLMVPLVAQEDLAAAAGKTLSR